MAEKPRKLDLLHIVSEFVYHSSRGQENVSKEKERSISNICNEWTPIRILDWDKAEKGKKKLMGNVQLKQEEEVAPLATKKHCLVIPLFLRLLLFHSAHF